jgi:hypothetical protein
MASCVTSARLRPSPTQQLAVDRLMRRAGAINRPRSSFGAAIVHELEYQGAGLRVLEPEFRTLNAGAGRLMVTVLSIGAAKKSSVHKDRKPAVAAETVRKMQR